jgi:hypothetical protein
MKRRTAITAGAAVSIAGALLLAVAQTGEFRREVCAMRDGKWGNAIDTCVTRACYETGTCGHWAGARAWCNRLKVGDPIAEVYFQLGEPDRVDGNHYEWVAAKGSDQLITTLIDEGRLVSLACT